MQIPLRIEFLGGLRLWRGDDLTTRFRTQKAGALLAVLAYHAGQAQPREELIDLLWPDADIHAGRNSLRVALSSLRALLEPQGVPAGSVLEASADGVRIPAAAIWTDAAEFEAAAFAAESMDNPTERIAQLTRAVDVYRGELLPGHYEDWVHSERERLREVFVGVLRGLSAAWEGAGDLDRAIAFARRVVAADRVNERGHAELIRLYMAAGEPASASRQYRELVRLLRDEMGTEPAASTHSLLAAAPPARGAAARVRLPARWGDEPAETHPSAANRGLPPLPAPSGRLVDRCGELAAVLGHLASGYTHIVSIVGPTGCGKTRLALEAAIRMRDAEQRPAWFASLAGSDDPGQIPAAVMRAMRLHPHRSVDPLDQIAAAAPGPALLVLDGLDDLAVCSDATAFVLEDLACRAPKLQCLVTTGIRMHMAGEQVVSLPPLTVPAPADGLEALPSCPSVQLFLEAAARAQAGFHLTAGNAETVNAICRRLEGLPLAIELAAAWLSTLSPAELLARLDQPFEVLVERRGRRAGPTYGLRSALEAACGRLPVTRQRLLARLSVFRGGWTLESAEVVCGETGVVDALMELGDASFVTKDDTGFGRSWFRMRETVRAFAAERLEPGEADTLARAHAAYFAALADQADMHGPQASHWLDRLEQNQENLKAAVDWCLRPGEDGAAGVRIARALWTLWGLRGGPPSDPDGLAELMERRREASGLLGKAIKFQGLTAFRRGDYAVAARRLTAFLEMEDATEDALERGYVLDQLGEAALRMGRLSEARARREESLAIFRAYDHAWGEAMALGALGRTVGHQGHYRRARALLERALERFRDMEDEAAVATCLSHLAFFAWCQEGLGEALRLETDSLARRRALRRPPGLAVSLLGMGNIRREMGAWGEAEATYNEALATARALGDRPGEASTLQEMAALRLAEGEPQAAAALIGQSLALHQRQEGGLAVINALEAAARIGVAMDRHAWAARLMGLCRAWREAMGAPRHPVQWTPLTAAMARSRGVLGEEAWAAAMNEGYSWILPGAIQEVLRVMAAGRPGPGGGA